MTRRRELTVLLALVVLWAPAVAASSVPDPTWIGGLYDGADGDELVALVWDQSPAIAPDVVVLASPALRAPSLSPAAPMAGRHVATPESSRAPPAC